MKHVITDLGQGYEYIVDKEGSNKQWLPQYGVWALVGNVADHVVETGDNLEGLKEKYPEAEVVKLRKEA